MIQSMSYVGLEHVGNSILFIINMSPDQLTTILAIARMSRSNASKDRSVDVTRSSNSRNRDDWSKRPDEISTSKSVLRVKLVVVRGVAEDWTTHLEPKPIQRRRFLDRRCGKQPRDKLGKCRHSIRQ